MAHHPEKFLDGHMLWRGRIYSPLPFVRSLSGTKINAGVWGTAGFPSVYRTDVHPFAFLPHSIRWQVVSFALSFAGALAVAVGGPRLGGRAAARRRPRRRRVDDREKPHVCDSLAGRFAARQQTLVPGDGRVSAFPPAAGPCASGGSAAGCRRRKSRCRTRSPRRAGDRDRRSPKPGARFCCSRGRSPKTASGARPGRRRIACSPSWPTGCGDRAPSARSKSTKDGPTIATSAFRWAAGPGSTRARWSRTTAAGSRCCASALTCARPSSAWSARSGSGSDCSSPRCSGSHSDGHRRARSPAA